MPKFDLQKQNISVIPILLIHKQGLKILEHRIQQAIYVKEYELWWKNLRGKKKLFDGQENIWNC